MDIARRIVIAAATVAFAVVFWPSALGGAASYVVVSGASMEPTLQTGDLVVTRRHATYALGDVVAFSTEHGDVIHRIIGGDAVGGYVMQGDNKSDVDTWSPTPASIRGSQLVHIPAVGAWLLWVTANIPLPLLGGIGALLIVGGTHRRRRRRRSRKPDTPIVKRAAPEQDRVMNTPPTSGRPRLRVAAAAGLLALLVAPSAIIAWRTPLTQLVSSGPLEGPQHTVALDVTGLARGSSLIYPTGRSDTISASAGASGVVGLAPRPAPGGSAPADSVPVDAPPLFTALIDQLEVDMSYSLNGATDVAGVAAIDAAIVTGRGYEMAMTGLAATPFEGSFEGTMRVDLARVASRVAEYVAAAGIASDTSRVVLTPTVTVDAVTPAGAIEQGVVTGGSLTITPQSDLIGLSGSLSTVQGATSGEAGPAEARGSTVNIFGVELETAVARIATTAFISMLALLAVSLMRRDHREHPETRIGMLYRSLMVDIAPTSEPGGDIVRVASMAELARLARRDHRSILHQVREDGVHRYLVPDADLTYEFALEHAPETEMDVPDDLSELVDDAVLSEDEPTVTVLDGSGIVPDTEAAAIHPPASPVLGGDQPPEDLPVARTDPDPKHVVIVRSFSELSRLWMNSTSPPARLEREALLTGGTRYTLHRGHQLFVYEAAEGVDLVAAVRRPRV